MSSRKVGSRFGVDWAARRGWGRLGRFQGGEAFVTSFAGGSAAWLDTPRLAVRLRPTIAVMLRDFIGDRKDGFIFRTRTGTPFLQSNALRSFLYPILEELGIEKQGFHSFRRFRVTHLESSCVPPALVKYGTGHAKSSDGEVVQPTVTDKYIKMEKDTKFRTDVAERIGLGFEFPKTETEVIVPSVPNSQEKEVAVSI